MTSGREAARNPDWTRDEVVLACDLVAKNGWRYLDASRPEVIELSAVLRSLGVHQDAEVRATFRNPNGVARKTADIATQHPDYAGRATRGGSHDRAVLLDFLRAPDSMAQVAAALRAAARGGSLAAPVDVDLEVAAIEGGVLERRHLIRERDPRLRAKKIAEVAAANRSIACEVCQFDFEKVYGDRGRGYIEIHHRVPLYASGPTRTRLADLAMLYSNCHRMIHRAAPWLTIDQLADQVTNPQ